MVSDGVMTVVVVVVLKRMCWGRFVGMLHKVEEDWKKQSFYYEL